MLPESEFRDLIAKSGSKADVIRDLGLAVGAAQYRVLDKRIKELGVDTTHFAERIRQRRSVASRGKAKSLESIMKKNSTYQTCKLKLRLIDKGILEEKCESCGVGTSWNGKKLALHLDHINGVRNDHRLSNLRLLCPNCHSQTDTYGGKNRK